MFENFYYSDAYEICKMCLIGLLVIALFVGVIFMVIKSEEMKVDMVVVSCEEGEEYVNHGARTMGTYYTASGKFAQGMAFNAMAHPQDRYNVVVEYNGVQYEIETSKAYEVGDVIRMHIPQE